MKKILIKNVIIKVTCISIMIILCCLLGAVSQCQKTEDTNNQQLLPVAETDDNIT